jgi:hypothetical protein
MVNFWIAIRGFGVRRDAILKVYYDGETTPSMSFDLGSLGTHLGTGLQNFQTQNIGVEQDTTNVHCVYNFKFPMPFGTEIKMTLDNPSISNTALVFFMGFYTNDVTDTPRLKSQNVTYINRVTVGHGGVDKNLLTADGPGCLVWHSMCCDGATNQSYLERNVRLTVDGNADIEATGTEDWFQSGWYYVTGAHSTPWAFAWVPSSTSTIQALDIKEFIGGIPFSSSLSIDWKDEANCTTNVNLSYLVLYYVD